MTSPPGELPVPRACFLGAPATGSFKIRATQIASRRRGWRCAARLTPDLILDAQVFCFVKKLQPRKMELLRRLGKTVVYDILDCWQQPEDGLLCDTPAKVRAWFEEFLRDLPADGVIFPNRTMMEDLGDLVPNPICLYHHFWPDLRPIEVRKEAKLVGYEGEPGYLGRWRRVIGQACRALGLRFVVNPRDLRELDIGFAARAGLHGSLMSYRYKSNVKLANFYGAAMPCLVEALGSSYRETAVDGVRLFRDERELIAGLRSLLPYEERLRVHESFLTVRPRYTLEAAGAQYDAYFTRLAGATAAAGG